eukprot:gnl/MRDRNA2_/MRDRNA2_26058_c0_seq1.p1 gnl/MRDRNA2_/MRDRNA2_26058_c0~~gnl/MRDRNA2_/MRDRNA2_26058_c0_seq1.p1  ORF type:complete len:277 (-),score=26.83 gnl/MRDRNA2_/MRDRNA2_26058_c0_seq1:296-1126(-)
MVEASPTPDIVGNAIKIHRSSCSNSIFTVHILDVGGNSRGTFEFYGASQVSQVKEKLELPKDHCASLVFEDTILNDESTLEELAMPTWVTLTMVIGQRTPSESPTWLTEALRTNPRLHLTRAPDRFDDDILYCCIAIPIFANTFIDAFGIWISLFGQIGHWLLTSNALMSIWGIARLVGISRQVDDVPGGTMCCNCACFPFTALLFGIWHLTWLVLSIYRINIDTLKGHEEELNDQHWIAVVITHALSATTMLAFGGYWCKLIRLYRRPLCSSECT